MAVVHEHVLPVAGQRRMGVGFPSEQGVRIDAGAMGLVAELDGEEISFRPIPAGLWCSKALARACWRTGLIQSLNPGRVPAGAAPLLAAP
jgi:hypothetical protein